MPKPLLLEVSGNAKTELMAIAEAMKAIGEASERTTGAVVTGGKAQTAATQATADSMRALGESTQKQAADMEKFNAATATAVTSSQAMSNAVAQESLTMEQLTLAVRRGDQMRQAGAEVNKKFAESLGVMTTAEYQYVLELARRSAKSEEVAAKERGIAAWREAEAAKEEERLSRVSQLAEFSTRSAEKMVELKEKSIAQNGAVVASEERVAESVKKVWTMNELMREAIARKAAAGKDALRFSEAEFAALEKELVARNAATSATGKATAATVVATKSTAELIKEQQVLGQFLRSNKYVTTEQVAEFKSLDLSQQQLRISTERLARAEEMVQKTQRNSNQAMKEAFGQMGMNNIEVAHYAAMLDRLLNTHTGLATVFRSGFNPALLGLGVALSGVVYAVKKWQDHQEDLKKALDDSFKAFEQYASGINEADRAIIGITASEREYIEVLKDKNFLKMIGDQEALNERIDEQNKKYQEAKQNFEDAELAAHRYSQHSADNIRRVAELRHKMQEEEVKYKELAGLRDLQREAAEHEMSLEDYKKYLNDRDKNAEIAYELQFGKLAVLKRQKDAELYMIDHTYYKDQLQQAEDFANALAKWDARIAEEQERQAKKSRSGGGANKHDAAVREFERERDQMELINADSFRKLEIQEAEHHRKLVDLMKKLPEKKEEILRLMNASEAEYMKKSRAMAEEQQAKSMAYDRQTESMLMKATGDKFRILEQEHRNEVADLQESRRKQNITDEQYYARLRALDAKYREDLKSLNAGLAKEREQATDRYIALVGTEETRIARRIEKEKAEWLDLAKRRVVSEQQATAAIRALDIKANRERLAMIKKEKKARIDAAFATANAIVSIGAMTKNKQVQQVGQLLSAVQQIYKAWETIHASMALFRRVTDATAAVSALKAGGTEKATQASMASLEAQVNAFNSAAAIPMIGWMLAPGAMGMAAAATSFQSAAITAAMASGISSIAAGQAHKGLTVPEDGSYLMNLQKGEAFVPNTDGLQDISSSITRLAAMGDAGGGGGGITINFHGTVADEATAGRKIAKAVAKARGRYGIH